MDGCVFMSDADACHGLCRFLLGLPLFPKNSIDMSKKMIADAKKYLGDSVIGFELGNEVGSARKHFSPRQGRCGPTATPCETPNPRGMFAVVTEGFGIVKTKKMAEQDAPRTRGLYTY